MLPHDPPLQRTLTVAIAGGSGSGKSTLAQAVAAAFGERCAVLDHDSYYRDQSHRRPEQRAAVNYDHPATLDNALLVEHLRLLRLGRRVAKPRYCFATHTRRPEPDPVMPRPVIVVEGILVLSVPELHEAFDLRVFVDAPDDVRFRRRLHRDVRERGRTPASVEQQWRAQVMPMHREFVAPTLERADLVVSGIEPVASAVRRVQQAVGARLQDDGGVGLEPAATG